MIKHTLLLASTLIVMVAHAQPANQEPLTSGFDKILAKEFKAEDPGAAAIVVRNGQVIYRKGIGMADLELNIPMQPDHVFRVGSITKQFTAVAILQLMEQGKLALQDEITKFIPDYPTQGHKITIEHLLTHTSGIQSYTGMQDFISRLKVDVTPAEMIDHFKNEPMEFAPGEKFHYNNSGYFLLGYIIESVSGKTYGDYIKENLFKKAGMTDSYYGSDSKIIHNRVSPYTMGPNGFENAAAMSMTQPYAAGSIQSTVDDLSKWNQALHAGKVIKKENLDLAFKSYKLNDGKETGYGYGWEFGRVQKSPTIEHGGAILGANTMAIYMPKEDIYVAVFANCDCYSTEDVTARLAAHALGYPYEHTAIPLTPEQMQSYTGVYENASGEQRIITVDQDKMYSQRGRNQKFLIQAYAPDQFFFEEALLTLTFSRTQKGDIDRLISHNREGEDTWMKTDKPVHVDQEVKIDPAILEQYVGEYSMGAAFSFVITRDQDRLFVQADGQEQFEIFARSESKFFLKINDAELEFVKDETGKVAKAILNQGGQTVELKKIK